MTIELKTRQKPEDRNTKKKVKTGNHRDNPLHMGQIQFGATMKKKKYYLISGTEGNSYLAPFQCGTRLQYLSARIILRKQIYSILTLACRILYSFSISTSPNQAIINVMFVLQFLLHKINKFCIHIIHSRSFPFLKSFFLILQLKCE